MKGTNTYLIGKGHKRLLIDTGEGKASWPRLLTSVLSSEGATIAKALLTHWHPDHVGGVQDVLTLCKDASIHKHHPVTGQSDIQDGQTFHVEGATLRAFHCPGHTSDHMAFILEEENAIFTGDNVLGHGTAVFEDLATYLQSLSLMRHQFSGRAYPAHGALILDGRARIEEYITHRQRREEEVLEILARPFLFHQALPPANSDPNNESDKETKAPAPTEGLTPGELVKIIYKDVPTTLHPAAEKGVVQILRKLSREGKIVSQSGRSGGGGVGGEDSEEKWHIIPKAGL